MSLPLPTEPDALEGAPHPRLTAQLFGQTGPESECLAAFATARLHHAWLISGPRGVGKATLAWKIARFLLSQPEDDGGMFAPAPPTDLNTPEEHPVTRRSRALSDPRLFLLRPAYDDKKERWQDIISVEEMRKLRGFFAMSAADGGRRVAIVDAVDDMNTAAANALLKTLEEPPAKVTLLLISHQPARLLPTIRSRCRALRLAPLGPADLAAALEQAGGTVPTGQQVALAELAGGSVGAAFRMANLDGLALYGAVIKVLSSLPRLSRPLALKLAEAAAGKGAQAQFDLILDLIDLALARLARAGATGDIPPDAAPGEADPIRRLSSDAFSARGWADLAQTLGLRARRGKAVNLDPFALLMDMLLKIEETALAIA